MARYQLAGADGYPILPDSLAEYGRLGLHGILQER